MTTLRDIGENEAIRRLTAFAGAHPDVRAGIGDDCAVVAVEGSPYDWLLTTDPVIEGVHFLPDTPGERIGHKAAGRVLSDLAAMGGESRWILFNLVAPETTPVERLEDLYRGATALCARHGAAIVGGDLSRGPRLEVHAFAVGRTPRGTAVLRSGARPGDGLYVTGALGGSRLGRHLDFEPRLREGQWLRAGNWATAMMDVSDGLALDLRRLLDQSGAGADVDLARVPVADAARRLADEATPLAHALGDGEDFELLFAVSAAREAEFSKAWKTAFPNLSAARIGAITDRPGEVCAVDTAGRRAPLARGGYEHFHETSA